MPRTHQVEQATKEDIRMNNKKCWGCQKQCFVLFYDWTGWKFCFKCWKMNYKFGREQGFLTALKELRIKINK